MDIARNMDIGATLLLFILLSLTTFLLKTKLVGKQSKNLPPSPPKLPLLGNLHQLGSLPHQSLRKLAEKYGPVMLLRLGNVQTVVISSAEAAKTVMKTHDLDTCSRPTLQGACMMTYNCLDLAFSPYGPYWREIRKICVLEIFSLKRVKAYRSIREDEAAKMINSISNDSAESRSPIDLTEKLFSFTASIIFRIAFGTSFRGSDLSDLSQERFDKVVHAVETVMGSFCAAEYFPWVGWIVDWLSGLQRRREKIFREIDGFFQRVIDDHRDSSREEEEEGHEDIVNVLLKIVNEQTGFGSALLTENNIKAVLLNMFLGGVDTSAITIVWAMAELAKRPHMMKKVQAELRSCVGTKGFVTESDTDQLHYLKMVVKETFRLHPAAPLLLPRETMSPFKINGYDIPQKTMLQVNAWAIGRDPMFWKDPEEFIPERFMDSLVDFRGQHFELLPFGSGRRVCPAITLGATTVELGLANLLYSFDWKLPDGMKEEDIDMEETAGFSLTISKKTPLNLVPVKRFEVGTYR